jgi:mRNA interferase HigB
MRIVSHKRLVEFYCSEGHGDAKSALEQWYDVAESAEWGNLSDIKKDFPATDYVGNFNCLKNRIYEDNKNHI